MDRIRTLRARARWLTTLAVLAALALGGPAAAAPARPPAKAAAPASAAVTPPARPAVDAGAGPSSDPAWRFGTALSLEFGVGDNDSGGLGIRLDAEREVEPLSPETSLSLVASLSLTHLSGSESVTVVVDPFAGRTVNGAVEWDANLIELVPTARLTYRATPGLSLVADGGLGVAYAVARARPAAALAAAAPPDPVDGGVAGVVRLAGGLLLTPAPGLRIGVELLGLRLRFGNGPGSAFGLGLSLSHRL